MVAGDQDKGSGTCGFMQFVRKYLLAQQSCSNFDLGQWQSVFRPLLQCLRRWDQPADFKSLAFLKRRVALPLGLPIVTSKTEIQQTRITTLASALQEKMGNVQGLFWKQPCCPDLPLI